MSGILLVITCYVALRKYYPHILKMYGGIVDYVVENTSYHLKQRYYIKNAKCYLVNIVRVIEGRKYIISR